jgi:hypothetical protein
VTTSEPTGKAVVANVATPLLLIVPVPKVVVPRVKVTVWPLGKPPVLLSVAVNLTDWPDLDGFGDDASTMLIAA